jgi:UPF0271 protein
MSLHVDLNSDLGEGAGHDLELLDLISSANISCAAHAGDAVTVLSCIRAAAERNVSVGAHPSFPDRENFGRIEMPLEPVEIFAHVCQQLGGFSVLATAAGVRMNHVKPHGALYNLAARDGDVADAIVRAILMVDPYLILYAPGGSAVARAAESEQVRVVSEVFADRNYRADGSLVPRTERNALLQDPIVAAQRVARMLRDKKVKSVSTAIRPARWNLCRICAGS